MCVIIENKSSIISQKDIYFEMDTILLEADRFFAAFQCGITYTQFKQFLTLIEIIPEREDQAVELFKTIDIDGVTFTLSILYLS